MEGEKKENKKSIDYHFKLHAMEKRRRLDLPRLSGLIHYDVSLGSEVGQPFL